MAGPDEIYRSPTAFIDSDSPDVVRFAREVAGDETTRIGTAKKLYYAVRDGIRYDPYRIDLTLHAMKASSVLGRKFGFCVSKAVLLAAVARAEGIPSRLGFADVKNHLATERLRKMMKTDLFVFHGYTELFLEGQWVKATPAFNRSLCERFDVSPLEFDGKQDSVFHEFSRLGHRHMEYVHDHGQFSDLPFEEMVEAFKSHYPVMFSEKPGEVDGNFEEDASPENSD